MALGYPSEPKTQLASSLREELWQFQENDSLSNPPGRNSGISEDKCVGKIDAFRGKTLC
jgi:hypothetical protein